MAKSQSWYVNINQALPPREPLAGLIGRLLVLRTDILIENRGITADKDLEAIDKFGVAYRRFYFVRAESRTLYSGRKLLGELGGNPLFKELLARAEPAIREQWQQHKKTVDRAAAEIERVRNSIGAHVEEHIDQAVQTMPEDAAGWMERHSEIGFRPRLAEELVLATFLLGRPIDEARERLRETIETLQAALSSWMKATNIAFDIYRRRFPAIWPG